MLDPFMPVYYTRAQPIFHGTLECRTLQHSRGASRSRLAAALAAKREACKWCAPNLTLTPAQVSTMLADALAVPA